MVFASIPSPSTGVVYLGPLPLRGYALMIILGVVAAVFVTGRRLRARGVDPKLAGDAVVPAVLFGIIGARIYHVVSSPDGYFGADGDVVDALKIWQGGLSIWGAVAGGVLGAWLACRRAGVSLGLFADAAAPGLALAQAIGRWGNWFNQELYGRPTDLPWAVEIDPAHRPGDQALQDEPTFHPTFLYESLWNLGVVGVLLLVDRRRRLGRWKLFALYVALYTAGRVWIEALRVDDAERIFGLRVNIWLSIVLFVAACVTLLLVRRPVDAGTTAGTTAGARSGGPAVEGPGGDAAGEARDVGVVEARDAREDAREADGSGAATTATAAGEAGQPGPASGQQGRVPGREDGGDAAGTGAVRSVKQRAETSAQSVSEHSASTGNGGT